jgi:hypothetical protein
LELLKTWNGPDPAATVSAGKSGLFLAVNQKNKSLP